MNKLTTTENAHEVETSIAFFKSLRRAAEWEAHKRVRRLPEVRPGSMSKTLIADLDEEREV